MWTAGVEATTCNGPGPAAISLEAPQLNCILEGMTNKKRIVLTKEGARGTSQKRKMRHLKETWQGKEQKESKNKTSKKTE